MCQSDLEALKQDFPHLSLEAKVVEAALLGRQGKTKQAQEVLEQCVVEHPDRSTSLILMTAQILLSKVGHQHIIIINNPFPFSQEVGDFRSKDGK